MEDKIKEYYGKILKKSSDLKTDDCCTIDTYPDFIKDCMNNIEDEILISIMVFSRLWKEYTIF